MAYSPPGFYQEPYLTGPPEWAMHALQRSMNTRGRLQDELQNYYRMAQEQPGRFQAPWKEAFAKQWANKLTGRNVPGQSGQMFQRGLSDVAKQKLLRAIGRSGNEKWRGYQLARPNVRALGQQGIMGLRQGSVTPAQAIQLLSPEIQSNLKALYGQELAGSDSGSGGSGMMGGGGGKEADVEVA